MAEDTVSLREHFEVRILGLEKSIDERFSAQDQAVKTAMQSAEKAVNKAESAAERRFESVNEFRNTLSDQARMLMPRAETEQAVKALSEKLDVLATRVNAREDRGRGMGDIWAYIVGALGIVVALAALFRSHA